MSVPNQYSADGRFSRRIGDSACGSTVPSHGANTAIADHDQQQRAADDDRRMAAECVAPKRCQRRRRPAGAMSAQDRSARCDRAQPQYRMRGSSSV